MHHQKDLTCSDKNNNMYLGPLGAAQQVLDSSPQTSHPQEKIKEGGTATATAICGKVKFLFLLLLVSQGDPHKSIFHCYVYFPVQSCVALYHMGFFKPWACIHI